MTRYVPGVAVHQGEGNRDELVIRGVNSSANFFVNGFRDDVQYFRDIYNTQSIEVLKGPSALTFGRGAGGGLLNRTLKEADGNRIYEATAQTGSYWRPPRHARCGPSDQRERRRAAQRVLRGQRHISRLQPSRAIRHQSDRDAEARRFHQGQAQLRILPRRPHRRPRQSLAGPCAVAPSSRGSIPTTPFAPNGDLTTFFGSPSLNVAQADVQTGNGRSSSTISRTA